MNREQALDLLNTYMALNPSGEEMTPAEFDDLDHEQLDELESWFGQIAQAASTLRRTAREQVLLRVGGEVEGRWVARVGPRVYRENPAPTSLRFQDERTLLEFLWKQGGPRAVLDACRTLQPRSLSVLEQACERWGVDFEPFRDSFVSERVGMPVVEVIDLENPKAPKWAFRVEEA